MTPLDLDRLADYAAGVLHGTPEEETVAALVATDPEWAAAHRALQAADASVQAALRDLADPPMPAEVAARLDAALRAEPPLVASNHSDHSDHDDAGVGNPTPDPPHRANGAAANGATAASEAGDAPEDGPRAGLYIVPDADAPLVAELERHDAPPARVHPFRRFRRRTAMAVAAAAVVGVAAAGGVTAALHSVLDPDADNDVASTANETDRPLAAPERASAADAGTLASGTAYTATGYATQARALVNAPDTGAAPEAGGTPGAAEPPTAPEAGDRARFAPRELTRLIRPGAVRACAAAHGLADLVVADLARFEGAPAVVLVGRGPGPTTYTVVVAGPACGATDPAPLARTTIPR